MLLVGLSYAGYGLLHRVGWLENCLSFFKLFAGSQRSIISLELYRIIVLDYLFLEFLVVDNFVFFLPFDPHCKGERFILFEQRSAAPGIFTL